LIVYLILISRANLPESVTFAYKRIRQRFRRGAQIVTADAEPSQDPASYPKNGTYADLLWWHLRIWGTRHDGSITERGKRWELKEFSGLVFGDATDADVLAKNLKYLRNWLGKGNPPGVSTAMEQIEQALFGNNPELERWKTDLRLAHESSRGRGNNKRTIDSSLAEPQSTTAGDKTVVLSSASYVLNQVIEKSHEWDTLQERAKSLAEQGEIERGREVFLASARSIGSIIDLYRTHLQLFGADAQREIDDMLDSAEKEDKDSLLPLIKAVQSIYREMVKVVMTLRP